MPANKEIRHGFNFSHQGLEIFLPQDKNTEVLGHRGSDVRITNLDPKGFGDTITITHSSFLEANAKNHQSITGLGTNIILRGPLLVRLGDQKGVKPKWFYLGSSASTNETTVILNLIQDTSSGGANITLSSSDNSIFIVQVFPDSAFFRDQLDTILAAQARNRAQQLTLPQ